MADLRSAVFHLPATRAHELKVWVHQITAEGDSEALSARLEVGCGAGRRRQVRINLAGAGERPVGDLIAEG